MALENTPLIISVLYELLTRDEIKQQQLVIDGVRVDYFYSNTLYRDEAYVADKVNQLVRRTLSVDHNRIKTWISRQGCARNNNRIWRSDLVRICSF